MKKPNSDTQKTTIGCLAIIIFIGGIVWLVNEAINTIEELDPQVAAALIVAASTVLVSVFGNIMLKWFERRDSLNSELRERKRPVYEDFITMIFETFFHRKENAPPPSDEEVTSALQSLNTRILIWGSASMVATWGAFRIGVIADSNNSIFLFEDLIREMRKDLGHDDSSLKKGDLLRLFINDIDDVLERQSN